jgi:hypothetical protein
MKWFRSNIRIGSKLALFALAIQFLLSFGHFHSSASAEARQPGLHAAADLAASHVAARLKTSDHGPAGQPADDCAICAVVALANTMVVATPPDLLVPRVTAFLYLTADSAFTELNAAHAAFQPRAPPIA